jgi:trans-aconitate methyltransferase
MGQFHWDPATYLELMRAEVPAYEELQASVVTESAGGGVEVASILELGTGTGETTRRLLAAHPEASLYGLDASEGMLSAARSVLVGFRFELSTSWCPFSPSITSTAPARLGCFAVWRACCAPADGSCSAT